MRAVTAVAAVRGVRHVLRQQQLLAVRLAAQRRRRVTGVQRRHRLHRLPRLLLAEEIQRRLPQRGQPVLLLAHGLVLPTAQRSCALVPKRSTRSACASNPTAATRVALSLPATACATVATAWARPSSVGSSPPPPFITSRSTSAVCTSPAGAPALRHRCTRCVRPLSCASVSTHEPACTGLSAATCQPAPSAAPACSGASNSHGGGAAFGGVPAPAAMVAAA